MENQIQKASKYLAIGIFLYPICYSLSNFVMPFVLDDSGHNINVLPSSIIILTEYGLPFFSIFYFLSFNCIAPLFPRWQRVVGYCLVTIVVGIEIVLPFLEYGLLSSALSFFGHIDKLFVLVVCLLAVSRSMKVVQLNRVNA